MAKSYWGETNWHAKGLPTPEELSAENARLRLLVEAQVATIKPKIAAPNSAPR